MASIALFVAAALAEIAGCFAVWQVMRTGWSAWWLVPGAVALFLFGWLLTLVDVDHAGRAYAAYGGIYVTAALGWLWLVEGRLPDRWDVAGTALCLAGTAVILFGPRGA